MTRYEGIAYRNRAIKAEAEVIRLKTEVENLEMQLTDLRDQNMRTEILSNMDDTGD